MRTYEATYVRRGKWWVAWCEDVPGALSQGRTLSAARNNLRDAIRTMLLPVDLARVPKLKVKREKIRV